MTGVYIYIDETGSCDYTPESGPRFMIGSATYIGDHRDAMWEGFDLRTRLEALGIDRQKGFHAVDDTNRTRGEVFSTIATHPPRFDATYLTKAHARGYVKVKGKPYLYQMAVYQHLKYIVPRVSAPGDSVFVLAGSINLTKSTAKAARLAVQDVCAQMPANRTVTGCMWEARSSWGIQVADYCLWALQRELDGKPCQWYPTVVQPIQRSCYGPWD